MQKFYLATLVLLTILLFSSCLKTKHDPLPLGAVKLGFIETLTPDARYLNFYFFTEEQFACTNYFINYDFSNNLGNLDIHLKEVEVTDLCLTATGPATAQMNLGIYQMGTYQVDIKVVNALNAGTLQVTPTNYILTMNDPQMLTLITDTLYRIPDHTIWGFAAYNETEYESIANAFLDSLEQRGATSVNLTTGDFGYFTLTQEGEIKLIDQPGTKYSLNFIYLFEGEDQEIKDVIRYFEINHFNEILPMVRTSDGKVYNSNYI